MSHLPFFEDLPLSNITFLSQSFAALVQRCFECCIQLNLGFAYWKLPSSSTRCLIIDFGHKEHSPDLLLENSKSGFVLAPFDLSTGPHKFIHADLYIDSQSNQFKTLLTPAHAGYNHYLHFSELLDSSNRSFSLPAIPLETESTEENYISYVTSAMAQIQHDKLKKIVAARRKIVTVTRPDELGFVAEKLSATYADAFVSFVYHPAHGCWMGASPEQIASIDKEFVFHTTALAGTQAVLQDKPLQAISWHQKEIEEQALVTRYISNCFKLLNIVNYEEDGPKTVIAGNLAHLRTDFSFDITLANRPLLASTMLKLLHPTSAVCGMPHLAAFNFIKANEGFERDLFTGYLGPVNIHQETNLYVNIRCAQLFGNGAYLFAGAGITKDSVPLKEWEETNIKMQTMEALLLESSTQLTTK